MTTRQKPPRLHRGAHLGIIAPSSPVAEAAHIWRGIATLHDRGFRTTLADHARDSRGYLAGSDADRADDLLTMLERPDIDAVICLRGGYGAGRTLLALQDETCRARLRQIATQPPKVLIGFSDITMLHAFLAHELNWVTFYGPVVTSFRKADAYTITAFEQALCSTEPFAILPDPDDPYREMIVPGQATGPLVGGCLSLIVSLLGTPWALDLTDSIFFFEDVDEEPYAIDRMLTQLLAAGQLQRCAGIVIGELANCRQRNPVNTLHLSDIFDDLIRPLGIPTFYNLPIGHGKHLATLPLGVQAAIDADNRVLRVLEGGVS